MGDWLALAPSLLVPFVGVALVIGYMVWGVKQRAKIQEDTTDYQAGAIAQRLGLRVERGSPQQNLFYPGQPAFGDQLIDVLIRGERRGVPLEIVYFKKNTTEQKIMSVKVRREWQAQVIAHTTAAFGHFEVTLRQPAQWNRVRPFFERPMPELTTGDARTDAMLRVSGDNPAIAAALGPLLSPLTSMEYVHVVGRPGQIAFLMDNSDAGKGLELMGVGHTLYHVETVVDVLTNVVLTAQGQG